jgi:hypothetical protein
MKVVCESSLTADRHPTSACVQQTDAQQHGQKPGRACTGTVQGAGAAAAVLVGRSFPFHGDALAVEQALALTAHGAAVAAHFTPTVPLAAPNVVGFLGQFFLGYASPRFVIAHQRLGADPALAAASVVAAHFPGAVRIAYNTQPQFRAGRISTACTALAAATVGTTLLVEAVGLTNIFAIEHRITNLAEAAISTGTATSIAAALLAGAVRCTAGQTVPLQVAVFSLFAITAGTTAAVVTALLGCAVGHARRGTVALCVAHVSIGTGATRAATTVAAALFSGACRYAFFFAQSAGIAIESGRTIAARATATVATTLFARAVWLALLSAVTIVAEVARWAGSA